MRFDLIFSPFACVLLILPRALLLCRFWQQRPRALQQGRNRPNASVKSNRLRASRASPQCEVCEQQARASPAGAWRTAPPDDRAPEAVAARSIPPATSARMPPVRITAGSAGAISAPMAIPMDAAGDNSCVWAATAISWKHVGTPLHCQAGASPTSWCGPLRRWPKASVSAPWPASLRPIPTPILGWLVEAAEHLEAFSPGTFSRDLHVEQVQMDELFALLSAVKDGEVTEAEAITRLSRSPHWVWVAMDPVCKLILTVDVGERTLAMAQRLRASGHPGARAGLCPALSDRWISGSISPR